jgi:hypothetical protein
MRTIDEYQPLVGFDKTLTENAKVPTSTAGFLEVKSQVLYTPPASEFPAWLPRL